VDQRPALRLNGVERAFTVEVAASRSRQEKPLCRCDGNLGREANGHSRKQSHKRVVAAPVPRVYKHPPLNEFTLRLEADHRASLLNMLLARKDVNSPSRLA
jgi:hypothetical protein